MTEISGLPVLTVPAGADVLPVTDIDDLTAASTGTTKKLAVQAALPTFNVMHYGAAGNGTRVRNPTCTSAGTSVTFSAAAFTSADVGKTCLAYSDTAAGTITTIATVVSSTSITLTAAAGITLTGTGQFVYGTDDSAAFGTAFTAAGAYLSTLTAVNVNEPFALGQPSVVAAYSAPGSLFILASQITVPSGVQLNCDGMIGNLLADRYAPCIIFSPYSSSKRLYIEAFFGTGIQSGTVSGSSDTDVHLGDVVLWHVGKSTEVSGLLRSQDAVALWGYGHLIDLVWSKGGVRGVYHNDGSDAFINRCFVIGGLTGVSMEGSNQVKYNGIVLDSCGQSGGGTSGVVLDNGCTDITFEVQAFCNSSISPARTLDNVVLIGNGSTNKSVFIRFSAAAWLTGGNVANFNEVQDVEADVLASNSAAGSGGGTNITTAMVFGTIAGSARCHAEMNGSVTPYTGTPPGDIRYTRSGVCYTAQGGSAGTIAAQTANGSTPATPTVAGNDQRGKVTLGSGTGPTSGTQVTITYASASGWVAATPYVLLTPLNAATAALEPYVAASSATAFSVGFAVAPAAGQAAGTYQLNYRVEA
jgi:hypothetical protein